MDEFIIIIIIIIRAVDISVDDLLRDLVQKKKKKILCGSPN
jgi:hypothetical protein